MTSEEYAEVMMLDVGEIEVDTDLQIRSGINQDRVREFMELIDKLPPWKVVRTTEGRNILADGFHRQAAFVAANERQAPCRVEKGDMKRALEVAIEANCKGPLSMSREEKRKTVEKVLKFFPERANSRIAEMVGVSMQLVENVRQGLEIAKAIPVMSELETRDGRKFPREIGGKPPAQIDDGGIDIDDLSRIARERTAARGPVQQAGVDAFYDRTDAARRSGLQRGPLAGGPQGMRSPVQRQQPSAFVDTEDLISSILSEDGKGGVGIKAKNGTITISGYVMRGERLFPEWNCDISQERFVTWLNELLGD